jgi:DNA-binding LacI/PurR family transcriptional regulator
MVDVARLAGVSHQTVSRVVNGHPVVREETRQRVLAAMAELDYRPNSMARALVTNRSRTLGLIGVDTALFGPRLMTYGIERAAREAGYFLSTAMVSALHTDLVLEAIGRLREQTVEGVIAIAPVATALAALEQVGDRLPVVAIGADPGPSPVPVACLDDRRGTTRAVRHLLELGHRTVHHIAGPRDWLGARLRVRAWRDALRRAGAPVPPVAAGDWSAAWGYQQARRLGEDPSVTALFCASDHIAFGAYKALHEAGRRVPDDVSVVGFDDIPEAGYMIPPLTTVRHDFTGLGRRAVALLVEQLEGADRTGARVRVAPELVVRASCGPPR